MKELIHKRDILLSAKVFLMLSYATIFPFICHAQNSMVGSMGGEFTVTSMGTASYSIPIEVVPGTQGVQPNLAISYNSASGRGLLGIGWNLTGLSCITRTQRNNHFDQTVGSINYDANDRYALDGSRLVKLSEGNYAATNAVYGTEIENFIRVTLHGTPNTNNQYFTAVTQDGTVIEYGNTADSKQLMSGKVFAWWVNKITDPDGNYMTFVYTCPNGDTRPTGIFYTGNTAMGQDTYAKVVFNYTDDSFPNQYWVGGTAMVLSNLLSSVDVYYGNDLVRSYHFVYEQDRNSRLRMVKLKDANNNELTRTTVDWGEDLSSASLQPISNLLGYEVLVGDFNGDNIEDLFLYASQANSGSCVWFVKTGDRDGGYTTSSTLSGTLNTELSFDRVFVADFDDNGCDDIGFIPTYLQSGNFVFKVLHFSGGGYSNPITLTDNTTGEFYPGDFTGSGKLQLLKAGLPSGGRKILSHTGSHATINVASDARIAVTENNGNSKDDLYVKSGNRLNVFEYDEASDEFVKIVDSIWMPYNPTYDAFGDFNGDGLQDYVFVEDTITYMKISKGSDYTPAYQMTAYDNILRNSHILVGDINGDGKDDIIRLVFNPTTQKTTLNVFYTRNYYNMTIQCDTEQIQDDRFGSNPCQYNFADLNGDGKVELLFTGSTQDAPIVIDFPEKRKHDYVVSITDGLGKTTSVENLFYNSPRLGYLGTDGKRIHYPLVSKLSQPDGVGGVTTTTYTYDHAVFDRDRQQLLGYEFLYSYRDGMNTKQVFAYDTLYHHMMLLQTLSYYHLAPQEGQAGYNTSQAFWQTTSNQNYHRDALNTLNYANLTFGRFVPYCSISSDYNNLENRAVLVLCQLDGNGRIANTTTIHQKAKAENSVNPWVSRDSTVYTYTTVSLSNGTTAVKPSNIRTWNRRKDCGQMPFRNTAYTYTATGKVATDSVTDSDGAVGVASYTYNGFGLPTSETYTPAGMESRTKSFAYDAKGRFLTRETNALGHVSSAAYDDLTGLAVSKTDANNLTTRYQYDALGRLTKVTRPDRTVHNTGYRWYNGADFPEAVYYVQETETGTPETKTYHDVLGRIVHTYREGQGYNDIVYDSLGRVAQRTCVPYLSMGSSKTWQTFTHDVFGRVTEEDGPYTDLSYSYYDFNAPSQQEYFVSVLDNIRETRRIKTYDALGRLVSAEDQGGTIHYAYGYNTVSGVIRDSTTVILGNAVTTMISDIRGNRITINDPDAGTVQCTYNAMNQLVRRVDANGVCANYDYDLLGRTTREAFEKNNAGEVVRYTYDNAPGKGVGKLASVLHNGDLDSEYVYDTLGRLSNRKVYDGITCYEHLYAYDTLGRLRYLTYSDGFSVSHSYNGYGELEKIRNAADNSLIYAIDTRNNHRQPLTCRFGNETGTQYTYNSYGMLTGIRNGNTIEDEYVVNGGSPGTSPIVYYFIGSQYRDLAYTYDEKGFIATRNDTKVNQTEAYFYDELDRLTSYKLNGTTVAAFTYDNSGNITSNTRVGDYNYNANRPHAVASIDGNSRIAIPPTISDVTYNLHNRPTLIDENGIAIAIDYDASGMRRHTTITNGHSLVREKTRISELYEIDATSTAVRRLDYVYAEGRVVAVHVDEGGSESVYNVLTDHLGSWEKVMDEDKNIVQQTHFDPWGNRMSYTAWNTPQTQTSFTFDRGFTGHEHYDILKIINANARLYDPVIGRFFSPDPFVQAPDFTQGFNRYSYCMNNPVMFSDPDGEIFGTVFGFLSDLIDNVFVRTFKSEQWDWTQTQNGWEIDKSIFYTDPNKSTGARAWEVASRLTWQLPQTLVGDLFVSGMNAAGRVNNITHGYGITAVDMGIGGGVTIGYFIGGPNGYTADWRDHLFVHEYGHYVQSQQHGPLYLFSVAIPSGLSALIHNKTHGSIDHRNRWFEADASYKGSAYFDKYYGSGKEGYVAGSPDFFDRYSFAFEDHSPYKNPRTGRHIQNPHPISGKFHWTDIPITGISIEVLLFLLSL